jgi:ADP-heptose:LPS heptosyltransferase
MDLSLRLIYLPIRAFGDFIITASVIKDKFTDKIPVILPQYLTDIFNAISAENYFDVIGQIDYSDQAAFNELHKVKDLTNLKRLFKDLRTFYLATTDKRNNYLLDYSSKRVSFAKGKLVWPQVNENIYEGKTKILAQYFTPKVSKNELLPFNITSSTKILILPGSRLKSKVLNAGLVSMIIKGFGQNKVDIAEFGKKDGVENNVLFFSNFNKLISLINEYDFIISAESLPFHLANFLNKPHFVIYNESKHFKETFMTPYMMRNNSYGIFKEDNHQSVINKLTEVLS